jgi:hypothetical protein
MHKGIYPLYQANAKAVIGLKNIYNNNNQTKTKTKRVELEKRAKSYGPRKFQKDFERSL